MPMDRFLIAPLNTGFQTDLKPWLIQDDAWARLENAYVFRGRVRKRFGEELMGLGAPSLALEQLYSRLRINLGNTDGSGNFSGTVPGSIFKIGQMFSIGTELFTVVVLGTPGVMLDTGASTVHTYNTTNGAVVINGVAPATAVFFYPAEPVMGLTQYEIGAINNFPSYGFDTQFAYVFTGSFWQRSGTVVWHDPSGNKANYFWSANWSGFSQNLAAYNRALFTTNFQVTNPNGAPAGTDDPIYYFDGTTWNAFTPYFAPAGGAPATGPFVQTSRLIVGFKNRLVLLNTIETTSGANINYQFRARYSWNGSPFATNAWYEPNQTDNTPLKAGGAGYVDASTEEQIISCEFIKDRLIVYFERSTWELAYTGNEVEPFVWQKINTELGTEATFSVVPFDKEILSIGNTGVHACNGANVARIDTKIPDYIFRIIDKSVGTQRVAGIRDYFTEMVYWTFPSVEQNPNETFQTKVLAYNYQNGSWAVFDDCINTWGYFEQQGVGVTWGTSLLTWEESDETWASGETQTNFRQVIAGNQEGYVFIVNPDISRNAPAMQLTNIVADINGLGYDLTIVDHTLTSYSDSPTESSGDFICIENAQGVTGLNNLVYACKFIDKDTVYINANFTGVYTGGGTVTRVSQINALSKQWNPYVGQGQDFHLARIDFLVDKTVVGRVTVDYFPSSTEISMVNDGFVNGSLMGTNVLETSPYDPTIYPLEQYQERLWHPIYFQTTGECIQIQISYSFEQVTGLEIAWEDFQLHALVLHTQKSSMRLQ